MQLSRIIKIRKSTRKFLNKKISSTKIDQILETIRFAPTACNKQAFHVYVIKNKNIIRTIFKNAPYNADAATANLVLIFTTDPVKNDRHDKKTREFFCIQDATIACAHAWLSVVDQGLSAVWIGAFNRNAIRKLLKIKASETPIIILPIGYADDNGRSHQHQKISELITKIN